MRVWVPAVVAVLLAGCTAPPAEEPPEPKHLLLGSDPCHADVCWAGIDRALLADGLRPVLDMPVPDSFAAAPDRLYWTHERSVWAFDVLTRELDQIWSWQGDRHVAVDATPDGVLLSISPGNDTGPTGDTRFWHWDWEARRLQEQHLAGPGAWDVLDVRGAQILLGGHVPDGSGRHIEQLVLVDEGPVTVRDGNRTGILHAGLGAGLLAYAFDDGATSRAWTARHGSVSPIWSPSARITDLRVGDTVIAIGTDDGGTRIVDALRGEAHSVVEGAPWGIWNGTVTLRTYGFDPSLVAVAANGSLPLAPLLGLDVQRVVQAEDRLYLVVQGRHDGVLERLL